jgi:hypothetical protein
MLSGWIARWRYHPPLQVAVVLLGLALLGVILVGSHGKASRPIGYDVHCFLNAARAIRAGVNPYVVDMPIRYNYPLLAGTAAIPLTYLPPALLHTGWFLAELASWSAVLALLIARWTAVTGLARDRGLLLPLAGACLLLIGPIQNHLLNGQTDAFVLLFCLLFWLDWQEARPRRAALWLGLGVSLKLVPALFFVPLLLRRSWSVLTLTCVWIVVLSVALPALFLGSEVVSSYAHYVRNVLQVELTASAHSALYPHTYTLFGALTWLEPAWKTSLAVKVAAGLAVVIPLCAVEWWGSVAPWRRLARLEAYLAGILLLAPLSQPHHLTLLLPGAWLLGLRWVTSPVRSGRREVLDLAPFALFPLWKALGGPLETVAVSWVFVAALGRASGLWGEDPSHAVAAETASNPVETIRLPRHWEPAPNTGAEVAY